MAPGQVVVGVSAQGTLEAVLTPQDILAVVPLGLAPARPALGSQQTQPLPGAPREASSIAA